MRRFPVEAITAIRLFRFIRLVRILRATLAVTSKPSFHAAISPGSPFASDAWIDDLEPGKNRSDNYRRLHGCILKRRCSILLNGLEPEWT
jgi:hypothetical protein